jgi:hypothetical protein
MAGLAAEQRTDEEIAEDDLGTDDLLILDRDTWRTVAPAQHDLLDAAIRGGIAGAIACWRSRTGETTTPLLGPRPFGPTCTARTGAALPACMTSRWNRMSTTERAEALLRILNLDELSN